ncbi:MAG: NAD(P)/FAD-dependent oxidoreductase [Desulfobacterales bacterium]|jgi:all-trans-retinol 13,14-reductase
MSNTSISRRLFIKISALSAAAMALDWKGIYAHAAKMDSPDKYPTVIIGAGLGGLVCGAYLARQGIPVTLVEQHNIPGGYATSFDRAAGRFTFEVSLHGTSIHNNGAAAILNDIGVLDKLKLVQLPEVYHLKTPKLDISVPQKNPEAYIQLLSRHFPDEARGIRGFVEEMIAIAGEVNRLSRKQGKFIKLFFPFQYRRMWHVRDLTLADLVNEHVANPELQNILTALWVYYGLPPSRLSGFYYANATGDYLKNGSYYIKDRSQDLSNAIAEVIETHGGRILYDSPAHKILVKDGAVAGIELDGGETLPARAVVSNASALRTFQEMLPADSVPPDYLRKLTGYKPSISSFIVWLGLQGDITTKIKAFSTFVSSGLSPEEEYALHIKGEVEKASFGVAVYDNIYKGYSSPGTSTLQLIFPSGYEPWRKYESSYRNGRKEAYRREKERWTDILIQRAEKELIPGLSSMIAVKESATPLTNWRYTGNTEGAIYGFEQSMDNAYMNRIQNRTPVKGLYLASAWGNPGGGYGAVFRAGQSAFQAMMEDWGA